MNPEHGYDLTEADDTGQRYYVDRVTGEALEEEWLSVPKGSAVYTPQHQAHIKKLKTQKESVS